MFVFLVFLSITIAPLNNIQPSFILHKNWLPNLTPPFPTPFHILPCFRYIMIFTLTDTSMDRPAMCMPPAPLPPPLAFLVPLLTRDLLTLNPKPHPLGRWLPCPCCWCEAVTFPCLSAVSSLAASFYLPETWKSLNLLWSLGPFSPLSPSSLSFWLDPWSNGRRMCAPSWHSDSSIHVLEQWPAHWSLFCISVPISS